MIIEKVTALILTVVMALHSASMKQVVLQRAAEVRAQQEAEQAALWEEQYRADAQTLAKLVWGEARGVGSTTEQAAVIWCVLNRLDHGGFGNSIYAVVTAKSQFTGYRSGNPVTTEFYELALDVLFRWEREKQGYENVGRVLPKEYLFFAGSGGRNWFRPAYKSSVRWDWSLESPYAD